MPKTSTHADRLIFMASAGSCLVLIAALIFQAAGYPPCHLCTLQRWPHLAAILIGAYLIFLRKTEKLAGLGGGCLLITAGIGIYHSLVERHLISGPSNCSSAPLTGLSAQDLLDRINSAPVVRCDEIAVQIAGLSMANLNVGLSLVLAGLWFRAALVARRKISQATSV